MAIILALETATEVCSVAICKDGHTLSSRETYGVNEHSSQLTGFIQEVGREAGLSLASIDAIAVSMGPGSYTGLRIGVSTAKGLCYALDKPLIAIPTLKGMAHKALIQFPHLAINTTLLCPMIDARRMEVYHAIFDKHLNELKAVEAKVMDIEAFVSFTGSEIALFGNGSSKCKELFSSNKQLLFPGIVLPSAQSIGMLAEELYPSGDFVNTAYFEPLYLKDFIAGKPKVKGLYQ
jgi:tRNA threonylcarbamoyladenosine biosynthesis protein TsaB